MRYLGSKILLLDEIEGFLDEKLFGDEKVFVDLFGGTNTVGQYFKNKYKIISNDILKFSYINAKARIENNCQPEFKKIKEYLQVDPFEYLNSLNSSPALDRSDRYYEKNYSPTGGRMYFTVENAQRIDWITESYDIWLSKKLINETEYNYLMASLLEAIPYISNITGTYGAYLKKWDKRALNRLKIKPIEVIDNLENNQCFNEDSIELVKKINADIVYIDTPYNKRQYASNYHVLENIANGNKPDLKGVTGLFDYSELRSEFSTSRAFQAMDSLLSNISARHVVISYSNEGLIPEKELEKLISKYSLKGEFDKKVIPYRKYKSKINSETYELNELLYYFKPSKNFGGAYIQENLFEVPQNFNKEYTYSSVTTLNQPSHKKEFLKSPVNYIGGKYKILDQILPHFPADTNQFVDLFAGGCSVGLNANSEKVVFNDMNYKVIDMFRAIKEIETNEIVQTIEGYISEYALSKTNEEGFKSIRRDYNLNPDPLMLFTLVSFSYNYQFRFNNSMEFNNPFGKNRSHFSERMKKNLIKFSEKIKSGNYIFTSKYFQEYDFDSLGKDDFVYLDPPYLITTGSYNDGNRGFQNWSMKQELQLIDLMENFDSKGIPFALNNVIHHKGRTNYILKEFIEKKDYRAIPMDSNFSNSSYNTNRTDKSLELLIMNY